MAILHHGTTRRRAEQIELGGPNSAFVEPGGGGLKAEEFSTCLVSGPFPLGRPEEYAYLKAVVFPDEGGPAIIVVDVPDDIIALAVDDVYFPLRQGIVQFNQGAGLEELCAAWTNLSKRIISLEWRG